MEKFQRVYKGRRLLIMRKVMSTKSYNVIKCKLCDFSIEKYSIDCGDFIISAFDNLRQHVASRHKQYYKTITRSYVNASRLTHRS